MANQGLKPNAKNISYELGIINAYVNINPFSSNLILDINLLQTIEYYPFSFRLFYNHLYKNQEFEYGYKGYNGIKISKLNKGKGSCSSIVKQLNTKLNRKIIHKISFQSFKKMMKMSAYQSSLNFVLSLFCSDIVLES